VLAAIAHTASPPAGVSRGPSATIPVLDRSSIKFVENQVDTDADGHERGCADPGVSLDDGSPVDSEELHNPDHNADSEYCLQFCPGGRAHKEKGAAASTAAPQPHPG
jgi:hypothetical protein